MGRSALLQVQHVADAVHRTHVLGIARVRLDVLAQLVNQATQAVFLVGPQTVTIGFLLGPDNLEQCFCCLYLCRMLNQVPQECFFRVTEGVLLPGRCSVVCCGWVIASDVHHGASAVES